MWEGFFIARSFREYRMNMLCGVEMIEDIVTFVIKSRNIKR